VATGAGVHSGESAIARLSLRNSAHNEFEGQAPMNARDVMSKPVVSVHPDTPTREIARLLVEKAISAVPVVDGLVIVVVAVVSLWFVVHSVLRVPLSGSMSLFLGGTVLYEISVAALGILLATFTGTMGQFGLLTVPCWLSSICCRAVRRRRKACRTG
jgi:hypothetical protein